MNMLTDNMVKRKVWAFTLPFQTLSNNNVMFISFLTPNSVSEIVNLVNFVVS